MASSGRSHSVEPARDELAVADTEKTSGSGEKGLKIVNCDDNTLAQ